jgi:hypothetical protein
MTMISDSQKEDRKDQYLNCAQCVNSRPNGVCELDLCTHNSICDNFKDMPTGESKTCDCGYWSCPGRGCGDCPSCYGEYCECGM